MQCQWEECEEEAKVRSMLLRRRAYPRPLNIAIIGFLCLEHLSELIELNPMNTFEVEAINYEQGG